MTMLSYWDPSWLLNYEKSYLLFIADNVVALQTSGAEVPGSNLSTLPQCSWALCRIIVNECGKSQGNLPLIIKYLMCAGEMLKFLCLCLALGAVLSIPMELTTQRAEVTTEDTSGRLLSLPDPVKCSKSKHFFKFTSNNPDKYVH